MKRKLLKGMKIKLILVFLFLFVAGAIIISAPEYSPLLFAVVPITALDEETMNKLNESLGKIAIFKPEMLNDLKTGIIEGLKNGMIDPLVEKIQAIADKMKVPEQNTIKKWFTPLLNDVEQTADEKEQTRLGFNRYCKLLYQHALGKITPESATILHGLRNTIGYANETTDAEGGFLIPTPTASAILDDLRAQGIFWNKLTLVQMMANTLKYPALDAAYMPVPVHTAEGADKSILKLTWRQVTLTLQKYAMIIPWTEEFMQDSMIDIESLIRQNASVYFGSVYDNALFRGDGFIAGIPGVTTTYVPLLTQSFTGLTAALILSGMHSLRAGDMNGAEFYMSNSVWGYLQTVKRLEETGQLPLVTEMDFKNKSLLGYPVNITDSCLSTTEITGANAPALTFGNFKKILGGYKNNILIDVSNQASFLDGETTVNMWQQDMFGIRLRHRVDIQIPFPIRIIQWRTAATP